MTPELTFFLSIIMAALASIPSFIALRGQRVRDVIANKKTAAETDSKISGSAIELLQQYRLEVAEFRARQASLEEDVEELKRLLRSKDGDIEMRDRYAAYLIDGIRRLVERLNDLNGGSVPFVPMTLADFEALCASIQATPIDAPESGD